MRGGSFTKSERALNWEMHKAGPGSPGLGGWGGGGGGGGGARPDLTLFTTFSPVFFFFRVIKSKVSVGGARVGRGARRGESRCEPRTSGALDARLLPSPPSQLMIEIYRS